MNDNMKVMLIIFSISILFILPSSGRAEVTNKYCPVTTNELAEEKFSIEYEGKTIYFCCNNCKKDFIANPDAYLANLTPKNEMTQAVQNDHEHDSTNAHGTVSQKVDVSKINNEINNEISNEHNSSEPVHDHATDHKQSNSLLTFIGKFHPLVIHFPIALVLTALLFSGLSMFLKVEIFDTFSIYLIYLAAISAVLSAGLGLVAGSNASYPSFMIASFEWHRFLGISSSIVTLITAYFGYRHLSRNPQGGVTLYRLILLANAILIGVTGHMGATLVYGIDYFNF